MDKTSLDYFVKFRCFAIFSPFLAPLSRGARAYLCPSSVVLPFFVLRQRPLFLLTARRATRAGRVRIRDIRRQPSANVDVIGGHHWLIVGALPLLTENGQVVPDRSSFTEGSPRARSVLGESGPERFLFVAVDAVLPGWKRVRSVPHPFLFSLPNNNNEL
jgi:hypothetical protein